MSNPKWQLLLPERDRDENFVIPLVRPEVVSVDSVIEDVREILQSGILSNFGPYNAAFEDSIASFAAARFAVSVSNATTGLMLLLQTLPAGSEVIVPSFTFVATLQALLWNRLTPVFADIDPDTLCIAPKCIPELVTPKTSAILAVHSFGAPAEIEALTEMAQSFGIRLFFDSAHALGSSHAGRRLGGFGDAEVFSFSATKLLTCGEGGVVCTNDELIFQQLLEMRDYGQCRGEHDCKRMGLNGKLPEISALLGLKGLSKSDWIVERRNAIAAEYRRRLSRFDFLKFQKIAGDDVSTYKDFVLVASEEAGPRDQIIADLRQRGIETAAYFTPPMHRTSIGRPYRRTSLPHTEFISDHILSIPIYSSLSDAELDHVCSMLEGLFDGRQEPGYSGRWT